MKEFKVGQVWRARDNKLYVITDISDIEGLHFPITVKPFSKDVIYLTINGKYYHEKYDIVDKEDEYDLVEFIS